jgi:hypothetical protein
MAVDGVRFHSTAWHARVSRDSQNWANVEVYWGDAVADYLPEHGIWDSRVLVKTGDTPPTYVLKGKGLCLRWIVPDTPRPLEPSLVLGSLADPSVPDPLLTQARDRMRYYRDAVTFVDAKYWRNLPRLWQERQYLPLLVLTPLQLGQQALLLAWTPVWVLLPYTRPEAFDRSWALVLGGVALAGVVLWAAPGSGRWRRGRP